MSPRPLATITPLVPETEALLTRRLGAALAARGYPAPVAFCRAIAHEAAHRGELVIAQFLVKPPAGVLLYSSGPNGRLLGGVGQSSKPWTRFDCPAPTTLKELATTPKGVDF